MRDKSRIFERVAELLEEVWRSRFKRKVQTFNHDNCLRQVARLERELEGSTPALRILRVVQWYEHHWSDKYVPVIDSGASLYSKFSRLEAAMVERTQQGASPTVDQVLAGGLLNGSRVVREAFESDILVRAGRLDLGNVSQSDLAAKLMDLYVAIRRERDLGSPAATVSGPMDLLRRYIIWLGERDWRMTTRVLSLDSPAFQQFRREEASRHPHGLDPITGR